MNDTTPELIAATVAMHDAIVEVARLSAVADPNLVADRFDYRVDLYTTAGERCRSEALIYETDVPPRD